MRSSFGMLIARTIIGGGIAAHGAQKAFGWFDGSGPQKTAGFMKMLGFDESEQMATAASYNELAAGALIAGGFLGPLGPALLLVNMIVAMETVHIDNGFFASDNGVEVPLLYAAAALAFMAGGYGDCSLDQVFGLTKAFGKRRWFYMGLAASIGTAIAVLNRRNPTPSQGGEEQPKPAEAEPDKTAA